MLRGRKACPVDPVVHVLIDQLIDGIDIRPEAFRIKVDERIRERSELRLEINRDVWVVVGD